MKIFTKLLLKIKKKKKNKMKILLIIIIYIHKIYNKTLFKNFHYQNRFIRKI